MNQTGPNPTSTEQLIAKLSALSKSNKEIQGQSSSSSKSPSGSKLVCSLYFKYLIPIFHIATTTYYIFSRSDSGPVDILESLSPKSSALSISTNLQDQPLSPSILPPRSPTGSDSNLRDSDNNNNSGCVDKE